VCILKSTMAFVDHPNGRVGPDVEHLRAEVFFYFAVDGSD
jgi:hypothetical protein